MGKYEDMTVNFWGKRKNRKWVHMIVKPNTKRWLQYVNGRRAWFWERYTLRPIWNDVRKMLGMDKVSIK